MCWTCASLARRAAPEVERVALGRYRWSAWRETLSLPTDAQALADRLAARGEDVLKLELAGHVGMPGWELLQRAAGEAAAQARALLCDFSGLLLEPDEADFAQLAPAATWPRSRRSCRRCRPRRATRRKPPLPPRRCGCCCGCSEAAAEGGAQ